MRQVSEKSDTVEPLLSQQLYDTIRQTAQDELDSALDASSELVRRGLVQQAGPYENRARQNIDQLKEGVERAAESVLGDGTESLRMAQRELDQLSQELNQTQAAGNRGSNGAPRQMASGQRNGAPRSGQRGQGQNGGEPANADDNANADQPDGQGGQDQSMAGGPRQGGQAGRNGRAGNGNRFGQPPDGQNPQFTGPGSSATNDVLARLRARRAAEEGGGTNAEDYAGRGLGPGDTNLDDFMAELQRRTAALGLGGTNGSNFAAGGFGPGLTNLDEAIRQYTNYIAANGGTNDLARGLAAAGIDPNSTNLVELIRQYVQGGGVASGDTNEADYAGGPRAGGLRNGGGRGGGVYNYRGGANYGGEYYGPLVDTNYVAWSDRLRDVEEMVTDVPDLSTQVAQIRERARALRLAYRHDGTKPDWAVVTTQIARPLAEVRDRVDEELLKRTSKVALVPLDRDPVPSQYTERVRRYYEQLGKSE